MSDSETKLGLRILLVFLGAWSVLPPYLGPLVGLELDVSSSLEVVDHVVPGLLVVGFGVISLLLARRGDGGSGLDVLALSVCCLAGFWELATHFSLWVDAGSADTPWGSVVLHGTVGPAVTLVSAWLLLTAPVPSSPSGSAGA